MQTRNEPLLASHMLNISYHGISAVHTVAFDADGGANTEGQFTFTDDAGAATVDCDAYNTLADLVAAIDGLKSFRCKPTPGLLSTMSTEASGLTQRVVSDMAATDVPSTGIKAMVFTNDYEEVPASGTSVLISSIGVPVGNAEYGAITMSVTGADAGATDDATLNFNNNTIGANNALPGVFPAEDYEDAWSTISPFTSPTVAINGVTEAIKTVQENMYGLGHLKLTSVGNADNAVIQVSGSIKKFF